MNTATATKPKADTSDPIAQLDRLAAKQVAEQKLRFQLLARRMATEAVADSEVDEELRFCERSHAELTREIERLKLRLAQAPVAAELEARRKAVDTAEREHAAVVEENERRFNASRAEVSRTQELFSDAEDAERQLHGTSDHALASAKQQVRSAIAKVNRALSDEPHPPRFLSGTAGAFHLDMPANGRLASAAELRERFERRHAEWSEKADAARSRLPQLEHALAELRALELSPWCEESEVEKILMDAGI